MVLAVCVLGDLSRCCSLADYSIEESPRLIKNVSIITMAILTEHRDKYEVRIKRYPDGTYFDEYEATKPRGVNKDRIVNRRNRYIVGEEGTTYTIEVTLHEGFDFGTYSDVHVQLFVPEADGCVCYMNIKKPNSQRESSPDLTSSEEDNSNNSKYIIAKDIVEELQFADVKVDGRTILKSRFTFRGLATGWSV
tara:strand:- start:49 stop:627 length:579 start_codon:yes stop_codon:yes gene_type:complete